jgi:60 kDa SS-A/Ro ribonucleoprotein
MVANNAGGYGFAIDDWKRLDRFLILGTEGGTFYVGEQKLTRENALAVQRCLQLDPDRAIKRTIEISDQGRALKNDPALFVLALAASDPRVEVRRQALAALPLVARIGTHLFHFADMLNGFRGWGRASRKAIANWYNQLPVDRLALQAVKFRQRDGWSHRDLLRLSHPVTTDPARRALYDFMTYIPINEDGLDAEQVAKLENRISRAKAIREGKGRIGSRVRGKLVSDSDQVTDLHPLVRAFLDAQTADETKVVRLIEESDLPREAIPTEKLNSLKVWNALAMHMPITASIRNLGKMTSIGTLADSIGKTVIERLKDPILIRKGRVHPMAFLIATKVYAQGRGVIGSLSWTPKPQVIDALDEAYELAFANVVPTEKAILVAVDVSGSMDARCFGTGALAARDAAAAMAVFFARTESNVMTVAFSTETYETTLSKRMRLDDAVKHFSKWGGGTDLAQPVLYALRKKVFVDAFVICTDNETWAGSTHASQALAKYRQAINPDAKLITLAAAANGAEVVDPKDTKSLGIAGFDANAPQIVCDFIRE